MIHNYANLNKSVIIKFILMICAIVFGIVPTTLAQSNMRPDMVAQCVQQYDATAVNVVWKGSVPWVESTRSQEMIDAVLGLTGELLAWDSSNGAEYPDVDRSTYGTETIGITLSDGTIIRFIFGHTYEDRYYGWLTDSTQRFGAEYNNTPQPHVRCGFWNVAIEDIEQLRTLFYEITTNEQYVTDDR